MNRVKDNRTFSDIEVFYLAQIEALRRALAERDMLIDALREDVAEMARYEPRI